MFSKVGKKIMQDAMRKPIPTAAVVCGDEEEDDSFRRFSDKDYDVQYHGGCDDNLTDE
jgi:hypothetical protein